ncbi:autotransporter outer membrane beta-barrel domain-containing protein [Salmonella enterica]|nr:autotransporter outer membrane beta-barrel domain-containing protein [Salmonella enterica]
MLLGTDKDNRKEVWPLALYNDGSDPATILINNLAKMDTGGKSVYTTSGKYGAINVTDELSTLSNNDSIEILRTNGDVLNRGEITRITNAGTITNDTNGTIAEVNTAEKIINNGNMAMTGTVTEIYNNGTMTMSGRGITLDNSGEVIIKGALVNDLLTNKGSIHGNSSEDYITITKEAVNTGTITSKIIGTDYTILNTGVIDAVLDTPQAEKDFSHVKINNEVRGTWIAGKTVDETDVTGLSAFVNKGTISARNGKEGANLYADVDNKGVIILGEGPLIIKGEYTGSNDAKIMTSGDLGGDDSSVNVLTIQKTVSGKTNVTVTNLGGAGGETHNGITVIKSLGGGQGEFTQLGRIVAGAYDYTLVKVDTGAGAEWRLFSGNIPPGPTPVPPGPTPVPPGPTPVPPGPTPVPPGPTPVPPGPTPVPPGPTPVPPGPTPPKPVQKIRPETGAYAETMKLANTLFSSREEQRRAVGDYTDAVTGRKENSTLWMSQTGGHTRNRDASGQLNNSYNTYAVQMGGTILTLPAGNDSKLDIGMQIGYGHARGDTRSDLTGYHARGSVTGYSTGVYGTWRQNKNGVAGGYVSTTLQYSWLKNQVKGDDLDAEKYDARGTTLSLEGGYDYAVWQGGEQTRDSVYIRPHAQITRMGVKADPHREANGTRVSQQGDGNVFSRTGMRVWMDKAVTNVQRIQPFVEANWVHNTRDFCTSMNGVGDCLAGNSNQAEVLAGVKGDVSPAVSVTAQAGGRFGSQASRDLAGTLNMSVKF